MTPKTIDEVRATLLSAPEDHEFEPPDVAETFRAWCAESERSEAEARQEIHEIATNVMHLTGQNHWDLWQIWVQSRPKILASQVHAVQAEVDSAGSISDPTGQRGRVA